MVRIERIQKQTWAGVTKYSGATEVLAPFWSKKKRSLITGLTKEDEERLEEALSMKKGELDVRSTYWEEFNIPFSNNYLELDPSDALSELQLLFLKAHPLVAEGRDDKSSAKFTYVIIDEEAEATRDNARRSIKAKAYQEFLKCSLVDRANILTVLEHNVEGLSSNKVESVLGDIVERKPEKFLKVVEDSLLQVKVAIMSAINYGILTKTKGDIDKASIYYEDTFLGQGLGDASKNLGATKMQGSLITIKRNLADARVSGQGYSIADPIAIPVIGEDKAIVEEAKKAPKRGTKRDTGVKGIKEISLGVDDLDYED